MNILTMAAPPPVPLEYRSMLSVLHSSGKIHRYTGTHNSAGHEERQQSFENLTVQATPGAQPVLQQLHPAEMEDARESPVA